MAGGYGGGGWGTEDPFTGTGYYGLYHGHASYGPYGPHFQSMSDHAIQQIIYNAINQDPNVPYTSNIRVEVRAGGVTLRGVVPDKRAKWSAESDAWWVPGVVDVDNDLHIARH